ncbi:MAG: hypothetical protein GX974_03960 [Clostridiales bacterium]|nr:hypothetical protein [Clostridiales bacterium]
MHDKYNILDKIADDIDIKRHDKEPDSIYASRIIYSALGMWIRFSTLESSEFKEYTGDVGVSKRYILSSCKPIVESMLKLFPETIQWFYPQGNGDHPIAVIRDRLYDGGELVDKGYSTDLALPEYEECYLGHNLKLMRGLNGKDFYSVTGLAQIHILEDGFKKRQGSVGTFYGLTEYLAYDFLKRYISNISWKPTNNLYEVFNKYMRAPFSKCWDIHYSFQEGDITLFRNEFLDAGFITKRRGTIYIYELDRYFIEEFELRRFMYGLRHEVNNKSTAYYKVDENSGLVELYLHNALPKREESLLLILGWPIDNIDAIHHMLFRLEVWPIVELVLKRLHIILREAKT